MKLSKVVTPCKGRSRNTSSYFCPYKASLFLLLITQGAALGYGIHWAFSPPLLNPKLVYKNCCTSGSPESGRPPHFIKHYTVVIILSSAYLAPIQYYAHLYAADHALVDLGEHYVKQTYRNRCYIATPSGAQPLTLPVVRDGVGRTPMGKVRLSDHGDWRHLHWNALASAYEGSPYFEYYADDFRPLYEHPFEYLADFNAALHNVVLSLLSLTPSIEVSRDYVAEVPAGAADLRNLVSPKVPVEHDAQFRVQPYYQVFKERTGFLPNLSIVDLLFNMGPESRMVLKQSLI